jgi:uncharacterized membrane protein
MTTKSNFGLAAAAAIFALSAGVTGSVHAESSKAKAETVHCFGVNSCKGTSDCKSYNHDCKGMNDCKGQGFKAESAKKCAADGGTTTQP